VFDRLIELLLQSIGWLVPFSVVDDFERGVVLRFGKFHRELEPGFHWMIPVGVERIIKDNVVPRTINLKAQALQTSDGRSVTVTAVVTAQIVNVRKAILEVETVDNVLEDSCYGAIGALVASTSWDDIRAEGFADMLTKSCRKTGFRYGVEITRVQLSDVALCRAIRLYQ
jgi:regulator of protease activity HflC (stomatin/prohibitin superfamily)